MQTERQFVQENNISLIQIIKEYIKQNFNHSRQGALQFVQNQDLNKIFTPAKIKEYYNKILKEQEILSSSELELSYTSPYRRKKSPETKLKLIKSIFQKICQESNARQQNNKQENYGNKSAKNISKLLEQEFGISFRTIEREIKNCKEMMLEFKIEAKIDQLEKFTKKYEEEKLQIPKQELSQQQINQIKNILTSENKCQFYSHQQLLNFIYEKCGIKLQSKTKVLQYHFQGYYKKKTRTKSQILKKKYQQQHKNSSHNSFPILDINLSDNQESSQNQDNQYSQNNNVDTNSNVDQRDIQIQQIQNEERGHSYETGFNQNYTQQMLQEYNFDQNYEQQMNQDHHFIDNCINDGGQQIQNMNFQQNLNYYFNDNVDWQLQNISEKKNYSHD